LHSTSTDRGMQSAFLQWSALSRLDRLNRDVYFFVSCGGEALASALHLLIKPSDGFEPRFSAVEKAEHLKLKQMFPRFSESVFVWSEGPFLDAESVSPWIWAPVGISERGVWRVKLESQDAYLDQYVGALLADLQLQNPLRKWSWAELHYEHEQQFQVFDFLLPWINRLKSVINPREFFFFKSWQDELVSEWKFVGLRDRDAWIQFEFLGAREIEEIEQQLQESLTRTGLAASVQFKQTYFKPFLRSPLYGHEVEALLEVLSEVPQVKVAPVISQVDSEGFLFRKRGIQTLEFTGLYSSHSAFEKRRHEKFDDVAVRALDLHAEILQKILYR